MNPLRRCSTAFTIAAAYLLVHAVAAFTLMLEEFEASAAADFVSVFVSGLVVADCELADAAEAVFAVFVVPVAATATATPLTLPVCAADLACLQRASASRAVNTNRRPLAACSIAK